MEQRLSETVKVRELRFALTNLTKGIATEQADGSWVVEKQVAWPFERLSSSDLGCDQTQVGISAKSVSESGVVKLHQNCDLQIDTGTKRYALACAPFEPQVSKATLKFGNAANGYGIWYVKFPEGEEFKLSLGAYKADGTHFADFTVDQNPGEKLKVKFTRNSSL